MTDNDLAHVGVKGMRWGVRKGVGSPRAGKKLKGTGQSVDARRVQKIKKKKVSQMSNEELKLLTTRMQLEQNYAKLNPSKIQRGIKAVKAVGDTINTINTVVNAKNSTIGKVITEAMLKAKNKDD